MLPPGKSLLRTPVRPKCVHLIITRPRSRAIWAHRPLMREGRKLFIWCLPNKWSLNFQIFMGESPQDQELMVSSCLELPAWQLSLQVHFLPPLGWLPPCLLIQKDKTRGDGQRACNSPYCLGRDFLDVGFRALKPSSAQRLPEAPRLGWECPSYPVLPLRDDHCNWLSRSCCEAQDSAPPPPSRLLPCGFAANKPTKRRVLLCEGGQGSQHP